MSSSAPRAGLPALIVPALLALAVLLFAGSARAERVRATRATKVYQRTGEQSDVVTRAARGHTLDVLARQGRWLKVRVNGRTGWVTKSSVAALEKRDVPRNTRRRPFVDGRSTRRGWSGRAPDDRIGADATEGDADAGDAGDGDEARPRRATRDDRDRDDAAGDDAAGDDAAGDDMAGDDAAATDDLRMVTVTVGKARVYPRASRRAKPIRSIRRGARLTVLDESASGGWIRVEDEDGDAGWIAASAVAPEGGAARPGHLVGLGARVGIASVGGHFDSNAAASTNPPADYDYGSTAVSLAVGGQAAVAVGAHLYLGAGLEYLGCVATPGIRYQDQDIGFKTHDLDARALIGYDFRGPRGLTAWARLGYHLGMFSVANLNNAAQLPTETFAGPAVGAALALPRLTRSLGVEASIDLVYPGNRKQTAGNEDGTTTSAMAATVQVGAAYAWKGAWKLAAVYRLGYASTRWSGASARVTGATAAQRTNRAHVVTAGLSRSF